MVVKEAIFSHEEFMEKLGLKGDFEAIRNIVVAMKDPSPRIEVVYHSSEAKGDREMKVVVLIERHDDEVEDAIYDVARRFPRIELDIWLNTQWARSQALQSLST